jgi:hypothetical protein
MSLEIHFGAGWQRSAPIRKWDPKCRLKKRFNGHSGLVLGGSYLIRIPWCYFALLGTMRF